MVNCEYLVFSDASSITNDNKSVLHGIFNVIYSKEVPVVYPVLSISFQLDGEEIVPGKEIVLKLRDVMGEKDILTHNLKASSDTVEGRFRGILQVGGVTFESFGLYKLILEVDGKQVAASKLYVRKSV